VVIVNTICEQAMHILLMQVIRMVRTHVAFIFVQYRFRFSVSTQLSVRSATLFIILYTHFPQLSIVLICNIRHRCLHCDCFAVHIPGLV
jgi:hypothetical protein